MTSEPVTLERAVSLGKRGANQHTPKEDVATTTSSPIGRGRDYITARLIRDGHTEDAQAVQVELLSARKLGEMLAATVNHEGGRPLKNGNTRLPFSLDDLGIAKMQSSRWQQLAAVPRDAFDDYGLDF